MKRYTVVKHLSTQQKIGSVVTDSDFKLGVAAILVQRGALAPVHTPPLSELPGWATRSRKLETIGIITVSDFLDSDDLNISQLFKYKVTTIQKWKREARDWITASQPARKRTG